MAEEKRVPTPDEIMARIVDTIQSLIALAQELVVLHQSVALCRRVECPPSILETALKIVEAVERHVKSAAEEVKQVQT